MDRPTASLLFPELTFTTSRSSGPGGQNVNKVNTRVTLKFDVNGSTILTPEQKDRILNKAVSKLTATGLLIISAQEKRSQLQNKETVIRKFDDLLASIFRKQKIRKKTKPTSASLKKRAEDKRKKSEKKQWRKKIS